MLLFRLAEKSLGLISTIVLARLLVPEDFGLVAMAMSIIALVELASAFSFELALIQKDSPTRAHYDTVWTLNLLFAIACALVMAALAMPAASFYSEPRLVAVVCVVAVGWALQGIENVGVVDFRRSMNFQREFVFLAVKKVVAFGVTVALAFSLRSYWALVIGALAGRATGTVASFVMSSYRPRLSLAARRELFAFSSWLLVVNVVAFIETRFAHFFVGRAHGVTSLGLFTIGADLANIPTYEISAPINRAAFPAYSRVAKQLELLRSEVTTVVGMIALVTVPMALGTVGLAQPLIALVMGERWLPVVPLLGILVVGACARAIMSNYHATFLALGRPHLTPMLEGSRLMLMVPLTFALSAQWGLHGVAWAQSVSIALGFIVSSAVLIRVLGLSWSSFAGQIARPVLAAGAMLLAVEAALSLMSLRGLGAPGVQLLVGIAVGASTYTVALVAIWMLSRRPAGAEDALLRWIARQLKQWIGRTAAID
jgi:lipopolysaccharide exporter